jgi:hypothetical protein
MLSGKTETKERKRGERKKGNDENNEKGRKNVTKQEVKLKSISVYENFPSSLHTLSC